MPPSPALEAPPAWSPLASLWPMLAASAAMSRLPAPPNAPAEAAPKLQPFSKPPTLELAAPPPPKPKPADPKCAPAPPAVLASSEVRGEALLPPARAARLLTSRPAPAKPAALELTPPPAPTPSLVRSSPPAAAASKLAPPRPPAALGAAPPRARSWSVCKSRPDAPPTAPPKPAALAPRPPRPPRPWRLSPDIPPSPAGAPAPPPLPSVASNEVSELVQPAARPPIWLARARLALAARFEANGADPESGGSVEGLERGGPYGEYLAESEAEPEPEPEPEP
mmetsp:Transcript_117747/g.333166  ORF Transcript_117747/g.333166 Transcript_117747/m.333166 type:complete len:281 (-) Transcript_117747:14-856(-)